MKPSWQKLILAALIMVGSSSPAYANPVPIDPVSNPKTALLAIVLSLALEVYVTLRLLNWPDEFAKRHLGFVVLVQAVSFPLFVLVLGVLGMLLPRSEPIVYIFAFEVMVVVCEGILYFVYTKCFSFQRNLSHCLTASLVGNASSFILGIVLFPALLIFSEMITGSDTGWKSHAQDVAVQSDLQAIGTQLQIYNAQNGTYPSSEQGLAALVAKSNSSPIPSGWTQLFESVPKDPWKNDYVYRRPGKRHAEFDVFSPGPDHIPDTEDDVYIQ